MQKSKEDLKYRGTKVGEISTNTAGLYGTYKYQFPASNVYAKGKLGIAQTQVDFGDDKYDESGLAGGVGLGYNLSPNASVEAEYTRLPSVDVTNKRVAYGCSFFGFFFLFSSFCLRKLTLVFA